MISIVESASAFSAVTVTRVSIRTSEFTSTVLTTLEIQLSQAITGFKFQLLNVFTTYESTTITSNYDLQCLHNLHDYYI